MRSANHWALIAAPMVSSIEPEGFRFIGLFPDRLCENGPMREETK
jgi:hypothetical protein